MCKAQWITAVVITLVISSPCYGGWAFTYGGSNYDYAECIQLTSDGGYVVTGRTSSYGSGGDDFWVIKLHSNGSVDWQKTYGGSQDDWAHSIQETSDSGYIVAGWTNSYGSGGDDFWVIKLHSNGSVDWQKTYGGSQDDRAYSIQQTRDGGYIVAGPSDSFGAGDYDYYMLKLHSNGSVDWQKTYGGSDSIDHAMSIRQTSDDGFILGGYSDSVNSGGSFDFWILKLHSDGSVDWQKTYDGPGHDSDYLRSIQETSDGGYIVGGSTYIDSAMGEFWVLKLNSEGSVNWQKTYGGVNQDYARSNIEQASDGGYIVAGETLSFGHGNWDFWVLKLNSDGTVLWQKTYGGAYIDSARSVRETSDGGYVLAGGAASFVAQTSADFCVLKLDGNGEIEDCTGLSQSTNATVNDTSVVPDQDETVNPSIPSANPDNTNVSAQDSLGQMSDFCALAPSANFTATPTSGDQPLDVHFYDTSAGVIESWQWDFGDGGSSLHQDPSHTYIMAGDLTVSLTVTGPGGSDTESKTYYIHVTALCECDLVPYATIIPRGGTVGFEVAITNNTDSQGFMHFATAVTLPDQSRYPLSGYLDGPYKILLTPNNSVSGHISHVVPSNAQLGVYTYHGWVGKPSVGAFHECGFDFEVVP